MYREDGTRHRSTIPSSVLGYSLPSPTPPMAAASRGPPVRSICVRGRGMRSPPRARHELRLPPPPPPSPPPAPPPFATLSLCRAMSMFKSQDLRGLTACTSLATSHFTAACTLDRNHRPFVEISTYSSTTQCGVEMADYLPQSSPSSSWSPLLSGRRMIEPRLRLPYIVPPTILLISLI